ncbi:hypothetical protein [Thermosyntropha sp.]|uniref:hypothetical protein n=1 Tax=Thermosyntropha sp. TaxID=2740820 RepID=UPI0025F460D8|nr:hypothetical protein [Thermosyntropha sp.]MBO8159792.1 ABC transporter permease subunit [Thermosyntropha sp.]
MPINKLSVLVNLYKKEMRQLSLDIAFTLGAVLVSVIIIITSDKSPAAVLPFIMVAGLAGLIPVVSSIRILSGEWNNNTIYLMLSLPIKGQMVLGAKLLALITHYIIGTGTVIISSILLMFFWIPDFTAIITSRFGYVPWDWFLGVYILTVALFVFIASLSFLAQVLGHLFSRFTGWAITIIFIFLWWLISKFNHWMGNFFSVWQFDFEPAMTAANLLSWSIFGTLVEALIVFAIAVIVYNRKIEI